MGMLGTLVDSRPRPDRWVALMYHELHIEGRPLVDADPGYAVYAVGRDTFREHMDYLVRAGVRCRSLGEARARGDARIIALTFDDGCETDWTEAVPILKQRSFGATFFVIAGFLGTRGYMSAAQLRELASAGFELGSHSLTHRMLPTLPQAEIVRELAGSKAKIEDTAGAPVRHFSCPHGRWSPLIATAARDAGYETVSTSRVGLNTPTTPPLALRRVAVKRGHDLATFAAMARGRGLWRRIVTGAALGATKGVLGDGGYAAFRSRALRLLRRW
jgi:peptidoglycan/xylan/chitin deacetylase (PgdA/CDA1 family)